MKYPEVLTVADILDAMRKEPRPESDLETPSPSSAIQTNYEDIDRFMGGLPLGQVTLIVGQCWSGKTVLVLNLLSRIAIAQSIPSLVILLKESAGTFTRKLLCLESRISAHKLRLGDLDKADLDRMESARSTLADSPLSILDTPNLMLHEIEAKIGAYFIDVFAPIEETHRPVEGAHLVVIDGIQNLLDAPVMDTIKNRRAMDAILYRLSALAKREGVAIVATLGLPPESFPDAEEYNADAGQQRDRTLAELVSRYVYFSLVLSRPSIYRSEPASEDDICMAVFHEGGGTETWLRLIERNLLLLDLD